MNNEFENFRQDEYTDNSAIQENQSLEINRIDDTDDIGRKQTSYDNDMEPKGKDKTKKKRRFGFLKITAAAIAFGIISGAVFQGYYMLTNPNAFKADITEGDANIEELTQTGGNSDVIIPTASSTQGVVADVSDVVNKVMPSIVAINSTAKITERDFFGREFIRQQEASGSGIIVGQNDSELLIVTNNHVIEDAQTVELQFSDESKALAEVKGADAKTDLAILTVDMAELSEETAAAIRIARIGNSDDVQPGEMAIAIGNALGYGQSVTVGYISAVNRGTTSDSQKQSLLQTDAAINPGNSGGALLNAAGQVIGINTEKSVDVAVEGMGYAIPISKAIPMINELINRQEVTAGEQGFLGIDVSTAQDVTDVYAQRFNMPIGVYVNDVIEDSPAEAAGLKQGNIITGLDGMQIATIQDLIDALSYKREGQKINLIIQVKENGEYTEKTLEITLGKR